MAIMAIIMKHSNDNVMTICNNNNNNNNNDNDINNVCERPILLILKGREVLVILKLAMKKLLVLVCNV